MNGILGVIHASRPAAERLDDGLFRFLEEGSQGWATILGKSLKVAIGTVIPRERLLGTVGIGQTNTSPAVGGDPPSCAVTFLGKITGRKELRQFLLSKGYTFREESSAELIAHLFDHLSAKPDLQVNLEALTELHNRLGGKYAALLVTIRWPRRLYWISRGIPLYATRLGDIASDTAPLRPLAGKIHVLPEVCCGTIYTNGVLKAFLDGSPVPVAERTWEELDQHIPGMTSAEADPGEELGGFWTSVRL